MSTDDTPTETPATLVEAEIDLLKRRLDLMEVLLHSMGDLMAEHLPVMREPLLEMTGDLLTRFALHKDAQVLLDAAAQAELVRRKS